MVSEQISQETVTSIIGRLNSIHDSADAHTDHQTAARKSIANIAIGNYAEAMQQFHRLDQILVADDDFTAIMIWLSQHTEAPPLPE